MKMFTTVVGNTTNYAIIIKKKSMKTKADKVLDSWVGMKIPRMWLIRTHVSQD